MRTIDESRAEFNAEMQEYTAMIVHTEHLPFSDAFFREHELLAPSKRRDYTPPPWAGAVYAPKFIGRCGKGGAASEKLREEVIPEITPGGKYLVCDDYSNAGETFEIAMIRLLQREVHLKNIWCVTGKGTAEIHDKVVLEQGSSWLEYRKRQKGLIRMVLEDLGFVFPVAP